MAEIDELAERYIGWIGRGVKPDHTEDMLAARYDEENSNAKTGC